MTEGVVSPLAAGVAANPFFLYGWHTYQWAVWAPAADPTQEVWVEFNPVLVASPGFFVLSVTVEVNYDGIVSVVAGTRSEAYDIEVGPLSFKAGVPQTVEVLIMAPNTVYYVNAKWSGVLTEPTGVSRAATVQFGQLSGTAA